MSEITPSATLTRHPRPVFTLPLTSHDILKFIAISSSISKKKNRIFGTILEERVSVDVVIHGDVNH